MNVIQNQEFIAGMLMSGVIVSAFCASSVFRNLALAALAGLVCWVFLKSGGVVGVVALVTAFRFEFAANPIFVQGACVGAVVIVAVMLALRKRRPS